MLLSGLITLVLWQFPEGRLALYPFTLLATYAHEMGHGLTAILLGGRFVSLEMAADGSGVARHWVGSNGAQALVAAGGLVGPSVAGAVLLTVGRTAKWARPVLMVVGVLMAFSVVLWARGAFAPVFIGLMAAVLIAIARFGSPPVALLSLQFLSLQLCLSVFKDLDYMFSDRGYVGGQLMRSDSAVIADALFPPYWLWGAATAAFSFGVLAVGLRIALRPSGAPAATTPSSPRSTVRTRSTPAA